MPDTPAATPDDVPARVAVLEEIARHTAETLDRIDRRLDALDQRLDSRLEALERRIMDVDRRFDTRLDAMDRRIAGLDQRMDTHFRWLVGLYLAGFASLLGVMAHGFHWL